MARQEMCRRGQRTVAAHLINGQLDKESLCTASLRHFVLEDEG